MSKDYPDISDVVHQLARIADEAADIRECLEKANEQREASGGPVGGDIPLPAGDACPRLDFGSAPSVFSVGGGDLTIRSGGIGGPPAKAVRFVIPVFECGKTGPVGLAGIEAALDRILGPYAAQKVWELTKGEKEGLSYVRRVTLRITETPAEPGQSEISIEVP